jgi:PAS domain S-box-containing protein
MVVDVLEEWGKMIDAIDMMVSIIDEDFNLVKINRKMKEFFGEAEMKKCYKVFHNLDSPPETCRILAFLRGIKKGKEYYEEFHNRWLKASVDEVYIGGKRFFLHVVDDITGLKETERSLKESEEKYKTLVEKSHDAIYIVDENRFLFVNDRLCELTGYSKEELYEMYPFSLIHHEDRNRLIETAIERLGGGKPPETFEARVVAKDGEIRYCDFSVSSISYGGKKAILGTIRDQTERKKFEEKLRWSEERYKTLIQTLSDIVFTLDIDGRFTFFNERFTEKIGYTADELIGEHFTKILPEEYHKVALESFRLGLKGYNTPLLMLEVCSKNGERVPMELNVTNLYDGKKVTGRIGVARDITERIKMQKDIENRNEILRLINKILRHDILNDLSVIEGAVDMLMGKVSEEDRRLLENVQAAVRRSAELIEDMGELEKITESGELEPVSLREVSKEILEEFEKEFGIKSMIEGDCIVRADETIRSVISNIIRNSVIHGETDRIEIKIKKKKECEMRIEDFGKGIPDEIKERVFEEGFAYGETGRSGLGLYIVKKVVERYGGRVEIENNSPRGTVVILRLIPY